MHVFRTALLGILIAASVAAQTNDLTNAQQALAAAEAAGAPVYAKTLYDDAAYRARFAQENWSSNKENLRGEAQMRAIEATAAADAATAKALWLSTNVAIRGLQADIQRFGGTSDVRLPDESPNLAINRGATTGERIAAAQYAVDQAKSAGATENVRDNDLAIAAQYIDSAKRVSRENSQSAVGDDLAFRAEMIGRRAFYLARLAQSNKALPGIQLDRTRLAQAASERQAAAERAQREEAERRSAELQRQLAAEQANRQAQAAEVERLHQQIDENRRTAEARVESDRQARIAAEQQLDESFTRYEAVIATSSPSEVEAMRLKIEDQQLALRSIQDREHANADAMQSEIARLRNDLAAAQQTGNLGPDVLAQRQADILARQQQLDSLRQSLESETAARAQRDRQEHEGVAAAQARRQQADAEAAALRQQAEAARQQAEAAKQQAEAARQQAAQSQAETQQANAEAQHANAKAQQANAETQEANAKAQESQAAAEQALAAAKQAEATAQQTRSELEQTRHELAERDAETRRLRIQNELARIAATRSEQRGLIVTLNGGILFDTGKTSLKPGAKSTLTRIAKQLQTDPSLKIAVEGHTDNVGSAAKNQVLSEKRANAVRDYLVSAGIPADHISASGKGEEAPIVTNKTAAGRQQNRRVELVITQ
ncbi:MAG TPA: OmpA family protein [Thermoanaerobaculia bacterium]|jgi:outer membrane protein OmpA-like peptidoglycan-associated protein|nr:OmpA family protein [Thermoanaerobaculia bacterium]